jgi:hypothetical protein
MKALIKCLTRGYQLISLGGHGICIDASKCLLDSGWLGIYPGEASLLVAHIKAAFELAASLDNPLIVLSGNFTRESAPISEAAGMLAIARHFDYWGHHRLAERVLLEEFALDSLQNLLLSLALAFQFSGGVAPLHTYCVGWKFKAERYRLHALVLGLSDSLFSYHGVNNPPDGQSLIAALAGEQALMELLKADPFMTSQAWQLKRIQRNPKHRFPLELEQDPQVGPLWHHVNQGAYTGPLPFSPSEATLPSL